MHPGREPDAAEEGDFNSCEAGRWKRETLCFQYVRGFGAPFWTIEGGGGVPSADPKLCGCA